MLVIVSPTTAASRMFNTILYRVILLSYIFTNSSKIEHKFQIHMPFIELLLLQPATTIIFTNIISQIQNNF